MITIERIGRKNATILLDTGTEKMNLKSTNFIRTNQIKSTLYDTSMAIRIVTKDTRSISAAYIILLV